MHQSIGMPQIIKKLVSQAFALMCSRYETCDIEEFNRDRPSSVNAGAIIRFTSIGEVMSFACAVDLKVSDGSLRVDGSEGEVANFGTGISQAVQSGTLATRRLAYQSDQGVSRHFEVLVKYPSVLRLVINLSWFDAIR